MGKALVARSAATISHRKQCCEQSHVCSMIYLRHIPSQDIPVQGASRRICVRESALGPNFGASSKPKRQWNWIGLSAAAHGTLVFNLEVELYEPSLVLDCTK